MEVIFTELRATRNNVSQENCRLIIASTVAPTAPTAADPVGVISLPEWTPKQVQLGLMGSNYRKIEGLAILSSNPSGSIFIAGHVSG